MSVEIVAIHNEIVKLREKVNGARICVIRKIVNKLKVVKEKQNDEKGAALVERLTSQLEYLKKIKEIRLCILALCFDKKPAEVLSDTCSSAEDICIARLVEFKKMAEIIDGIKMKFGLDMIQVDWREQIKNMGTKKNSDTTKKTNKVKIEKAVNSPKKKPNNNNKKENGMKTIEKKQSAETTQSLEKPNKKQKNKELNEQSNETVSVPSLTVDSFFITSDGKNYMSTSAPRENADEDDIDNDGTDERLNRRARRSGIINQTPNSNNKPIKLNVIAKPEIDPEAHPSWAAKRKQNTIPEFLGKKIKFDADDKDDNSKEKLHPSWAAKQKLKPIITEFKGTKVKFDEDD